MKKLVTRLQKLYVILILLLFINQAIAQEPLAPLSKKELIDLFQNPVLRGNADSILKQIIRVNKIAFLPIKRTIRELEANGVPEKITRELKYNFSSHIVYRVCRFEPDDLSASDFTMALNNSLAREKERLVIQDDSSLLGDKIFHSVPAGIAGPKQEELGIHEGYVLIMGNIRKSSGSDAKIVTAHLVFFSRVQEKTNIASIEKTWSGTERSLQTVVKEIADWSIEELVKQIK